MSANRKKNYMFSEVNNVLNLKKQNKMNEENNSKSGVSIWSSSMINTSDFLTGV